jgi:hypothetical protein
MKSMQPMKPIASKMPEEAMKPVEEKVIVPKDSPDAKYTITGRRIL